MLSQKEHEDACRHIRSKLYADLGPSEYWHEFWKDHFEREHQWLKDKAYMTQYIGKTEEIKKMRELGIYHDTFSVKALMLAFGPWWFEPLEVRITLYKKAFNAIDVMMQYRGTPERAAEYKVNLLDRTKASAEEKALLLPSNSVALEKIAYDEELRKAKEWRKRETEADLIASYRAFTEMKDGS